MVSLPAPHAEINIGGGSNIVVAAMRHEQDLILFDYGMIVGARQIGAHYLQGGNYSSIFFPNNIAWVYQCTD